MADRYTQKMIIPCIWNLLYSIYSGFFEKPAICFITTFLLICQFYQPALWGQKPTDEIDIYNINYPLLEHLTKIGIDSVREVYNLMPLYNDSICYLAAKDHTEYLIEILPEISHYQDENEKKRTPQKRVEYYGGTGYSVGENVAEIYLYKPTSYKTGLSESKTLMVTSYQQAANLMVDAWIHSAEHFVNIISQTYKVTGVAAYFHEEINALVCVQVFADVDDNYKLSTCKSFFPYDKMKISIDKKPLENKSISVEKHDKHAWNIKYPAKEKDQEYFDEIMEILPDWHIAYHNNSVYLFIGDYYLAKRLFNNKKDGIALEIVPFDKYNCQSDTYYTLPRRKNDGCIFEGKVLAPVYKRKLFKNTNNIERLASGNRIEFFARIGDLYDTTGESYEQNILFLKKNRIAKIIYTHHLCGEMLEYIDKVSFSNINQNVKTIGRIPGNLVDSLNAHSINETNDIFSNAGESSYTNLAVNEYIELFNHYESLYDNKNYPGLQKKIFQRLDSIQKYLFNIYLNGKIDFAIIEKLPALVTNELGDYSKYQPFARLVNDRLIFKHTYLKNEFPDSVFFKNLNSLKQFKDVDPVISYNYYAFLINNTDSTLPNYKSHGNLDELYSVISKVKNAVDPEYTDSLILFYHFQRIWNYYSYSNYNYTKLFSSIKFIFNYYSSQDILPAKRLLLAKYFIQIRQFDYAYKILSPILDSGSFNKEAYILQLKLFYSGRLESIPKDNYYDRLYEASEILSTEEWIGLFNGPCRINFQILDYEPLWDLYCSKIQLLELSNKE